GIGLLLLGGCSSPQPEFGEVQGQVTLNGKPLAGLIVTFYPDTERDGVPYAQGTTDATGTYTLTARTGQAGAVVGKHRVVVNWPRQERPAPGEKPPPPPGPAIPLKYTVATETPLIVEVKAGSPQTIPLPLQW